MGGYGAGLTDIIKIHFNFNHLGLSVEPEKVEKVICVKVRDSNLSLHTKLIQIWDRAYF